jgi:hypothetical protein
MPGQYINAKAYATPSATWDYDYIGFVYPGTENVKIRTWHNSGLTAGTFYGVLDISLPTVDQDNDYTDPYDVKAGSKGFSIETAFDGKLVLARDFRTGTYHLYAVGLAIDTNFISLDSIDNPVIKQWCNENLNISGGSTAKAFSDPNGQTALGHFGFYTNSFRLWNDDYAYNISGTAYSHLIVGKNAGGNQPYNQYNDPYRYLEDDLGVKNITKNGSYSAINDSVNGWDRVNVNVQPDLIDKYVIENGTYDAEDDNVDGYSSVEVYVPLGPNDYRLKSVANLPQAIASFNDGENMVMPSLKVAIEPQQDLHGYDSPWVGGAGKNLFDKPNLVMNKAIPAGTTIYGQIFGVTASFKLYGYDEENTEYEVMSLSINKNSTTTTRAYVRLEISQSALNALGDGNLMVSLSDFTRFAPYSNICPIIGHTEANVTRCGKNLFDKTTISENKIIDNKTGEEITAYNRFSSDYIKVNSSTDYYASNVIKSSQWYCAFYYYKNKNYLSCGDLSSTGDTASGVITTPSNCNYVRLVSLTTYKDDVSFVVGNQAPTSYEAYNGNTYNIQFRDGDNPLTVYGGYIDWKNNRIVVIYGVADMGALSWSYNSTYKVFYTYINTSVSNVPPKKAGFTNFMSEIYKVVETAYQNLNNGEISGTSTDTGVNVKNLTYDNVIDFTTAMNGIKFVYELATPVIIPLDLPQVKSLLGSNNVWADTGNVLEGEYFSRSESVKLPLPSEFVDDQATHITIPNFSSYDKLKIDYKSINSQLQTVTISISSLPENNNPDWGQGGDIYIVNGFYYLVMSRDSTGIWFKECGNPLQQLTAIRI